MDAPLWAVIDSLYHAALAKEPGDRSSYLDVVCGEDPRLRSEIESLLAYAEAHLSSPADRLEVTKLWEQIAGNPAAGTLTSGQPIDSGTSLPATIGRYRILRLLGEGGMGAVYEAEQEHPRRTVALKVIKPGLTNSELLRRFEQESQAIARLQHPGIAQIYEAGNADSGFGLQPYFAMEFIRGESLLQHSEVHQLNTRQRLELMAKVCEAVHHAHQRGIIHRDLKPGNILVDESGQPKVLDFGVARATNSDAQATRQTDLGQLVGTLAYMSPEQVLADPLEIDTRSDVYSLGVIVYELLAGRLPYKVSRQLHEAVQTIREADPGRLSSVSRAYRGDIETIVAKALEKDKARRYASAAGMAGDIRRYLNDEPIIARPASATYQLQKFARRHKALVAGVVSVFVVLIAGLIASTWEATRARRAEQVATTERNRAVAEKQRADTESATAKAVNDFLENDLLAQASASVQARPGTKPDPDLKVRTALDRAAVRITGKFAAQPLVEASIRQTVGNAYSDLGLYPDAQRQLERALDLRRRVLGGEHRDTLTSMHKLAELYESEGKYARAEPLFTKVVEVWRRVLGEEHPDTLATMNKLLMVYQYQYKYAQAEPLYTKVLEAQRRVLGEEHPDTLATMNDLAELYGNEDKYAQAEPLFTRALDMRRRLLGAEHPDTLLSMYDLAWLYSDQGKYAQAEPLLTKVLEAQRRVLGSEHPYTLISMNCLAGLYRDQRKYAQAEPLFTKVLEVRRRVLGEEHPDTLTSMDSLAVLYRDQGKYAQAEPLFTKALEVQRRVLGEELPDTLFSMKGLASLYLQQNQYPQAEVLLRKAVSIYEKRAADVWERYHSQSMLGASLTGQKKYAEAEALLVSGYEGMLQRQATIPTASRSNLQQAGGWIVQLYQDWGKPEQAVEWQKNLQVTKPDRR